MTGQKRDLFFRELKDGIVNIRSEGGPGLESTDESNGKSEVRGVWWAVVGKLNLMALLSQWSVSQGTGHVDGEDLL